jgi:DNA-binding protein HU-beta
LGAHFRDPLAPSIAAGLDLKATIQPETMRFSRPRALHSGPRSVLNPVTSIKGTAMPKMTKSQLIDAISESSAVSKNDVKAVIEHMATVGYKELNESGEFVIPGFVKMSVVNKPATEARSGINPFTKEPMEFAAKPASKTVKASPLKVAKDAV